MTEYTHEEIEKARCVLEDAGYYCGNLWHIKDVQTMFDCTDEEAYEILDGALHNGATMEQIWLAIDCHAENIGLENKEV